MSLDRRAVQAAIFTSLLCAWPAASAPPEAKGAESADPTAPYSLAQAQVGLRGSGALAAVLTITHNGQPLGTLHCDLYADKAPLAVANFVGLARGLRPFKDARSGQWVRRPFFDNMAIHRVIPAFLFQSGDPACADDATCLGRAGSGDPGYAFPDEIHPSLTFNRPGLLGMARRGPDSNGSQFFVTEQPAPWLNGLYTIFGACAETELIAKINAVPRGYRDAPLQPLFLQRVAIIKKTK